jgi:hypothetical protein
MRPLLGRDRRWQAVSGMRSPRCPPLAGG